MTVTALGCLAPASPVPVPDASVVVRAVADAETLELAPDPHSSTDQVDPRRLPPGSRVSAHSLWREHRPTVLAALGASLVQLGLIVGLLYERRARQRAQLQSVHHLAISAHLERQVAMGALAAAIAHELNQPLGSILHNAEAADMLLASNRASVDEIREILRDIQGEDKRASQIIQRQRAMLRKHEPEQRTLDLNSVVSESLAIVAHDAQIKQVRIDTDLCSSPCAITGDPIMLQQVVMNLLLNALDAMAQTPAHRRRVLVRSRIVRSLVEVSVHDCGMGIAPEVAGLLFEPFNSTKATGMGLGLTIARSIIEAHGGTIEARNNDDGGATFVLTLPSSSA